MKKFREWKVLFENQNLYEFNIDLSGVIWLKLKSLLRTAILKNFINENNINLKTQGLQNNFEELYNLYLNNILKVETIDNFLLKYNKQELLEIDKNFNIIESELYKLHEFSWGGDATNSLDKQIVSYIKEIYVYDDIIKKIDTDIFMNTRKYTLNSWYNNWTSILTEHIFKKHQSVLSAVGKIKSVDFFINNIPIDLKITYFPKEFLKQARKNVELPTELTFLKKIAKENHISYDKTGNEDIIKYQIIEQIKDINNTYLNEQLEILFLQNKHIIQSTIENKKLLIQWLYEKQGEMRFGAENRLFIILLDINDMNNSWKLKRNFKLLHNRINDYLDNFNEEYMLENKIDFAFLGKNYQAISDVIFIQAPHHDR